MPSDPTPATSFHEVVQRLRQLTAEGFSGSFRAEQGGVVKVLYLLDGRLACASSTDRLDRLGTLLEREGRISAQQLAKAQEQALPGEALGSVLMNLGYIQSDDLLLGARLQVEGVLGSIVLWQHGDFRSRPGPLPERAVNLDLRLGPVLMACVRRIEDDEAVADLLGPGDQVLCALPEAGEDDLDRGARLLIDLLDGSRDLDAAFAEVPMEPGQAMRVALGLRALGMLERAPAVAAAAFAGMDEPDARSEAGAQPIEPEQDSEPGEPDDEAIAVPEEEIEPASEPAAAAASPSMAPASQGRSIAPPDSTMDEEPFEEPARQMSLERPGDFERTPADLHLHGVDGAAVEVPGRRRPQQRDEAQRGRRGWILGATLPLLALLLVFVFSGGEDPPPLNTATGGGVRAEGTAAGDPSGPPEQEAAAPAAVREPAQAMPVQDPALPPADIAIPKPEGTLGSSSGYQAGFDAFEAGDFGKAAALWRRGWQPRRSGGFTLQVMVACREATLRDLRPKLPAPERLFLAPVQVNQSTCYKVLWGIYASREEAEAAVSGVPALFTSGGEKPWPVPLSSLEP